MPLLPKMKATGFWWTDAWPRVIAKTKARLDEWGKSIEPSAELRKWFDHKAELFIEFTKLYKKELAKD